MHYTLRPVGWLVGKALFLGLLPSLIFAAAEPSGGANPDEGNEVWWLPRIFTTELPDMVMPKDLTMTLRPRFGDFLKNDYERVSFNIRYGLTPQWELSLDTDYYLAHGLGGESFASKGGISRAQAGVKYQFREFLKPYWDAAAGVKYGTPIGTPPSQLTDGLTHIGPFMTMAHPWKDRPKITSYLSFGLDLVDRVQVQDDAKENADSNSWFVTPGVTLHRGAFRYSLETPLGGTSLVGKGNDYSVAVRPAIEWKIPTRFTFSSKNHWMVGAGLSVGYGSQGPQFGVSGRFQTDFDFKGYIRRCFVKSPPVAKD